jgi:type II secretory pathway pseudopilin PulG
MLLKSPYNSGTPTVKLPRRKSRVAEAGFTLIEIVIVSVLMLSLVIVTWNALLMLDLGTRRMSEQTSALAIVQGKLEEIRNESYNPPTSPYTAATLTTTTNVSFAIDAAGTNFLVNGQMIIEYKPAAVGHLVTVTASFTNFGKSYSPQVQTVINKFSKIE